MSHSTVDDNASMTLANQKVLIYNTDTQETQVYDGNNVLLQGDTVFVTVSAAMPKSQRKYKVLQKKRTDYANCFIAVKNIADGGKRKRKTIKASELGPEFMALMTMNADIDNRLLQHATRSFKKKYAIDDDTYIDYDYLDVDAEVDANDNTEIDGGAKKKKKRTTTRRRKNKKATKRAFGMDVDEYEELQEDVILDQDTDALGDIAVDKLSLKNDAQLSGAGNIFDQLGAQFVTQRAIIQGGGDRLIAQCECDANQQYQELVDRGAERHKQSCKAVVGGAENDQHLSTDDVIDDVMNVICTDKDGKVIENIEVNENNPVLIDKVIIPEKKKDKSNINQQQQQDKQTTGDTSKDKTEQQQTKPNAKKGTKPQTQPRTDKKTSTARQKKQENKAVKKNDGPAPQGEEGNTTVHPDGPAPQEEQGNEAVKKTDGPAAPQGEQGNTGAQQADATGGAKVKRAEDYLSSSESSSISDADDSESSSSMSTDESSSTMSEISADDDIKQYNADGSDTGTAVMYF